MIMTERMSKCCNNMLVICFINMNRPHLSGRSHRTEGAQHPKLNHLNIYVRHIKRKRPSTGLGKQC